MMCNVLMSLFFLAVLFLRYDMPSYWPECYGRQGYGSSKRSVATGVCDVTMFVLVAFDVVAVAVKRNTSVQRCVTDIH